MTGKLDSFTVEEKKAIVEKVNELEAVAFKYSENEKVFGMDCSEFEQLMFDISNIIQSSISKTNNTAGSLAKYENDCENNEIDNAISTIERI